MNIDNELVLIHLNIPEGPGGPTRGESLERRSLKLLDTCRMRQQLAAAAIPSLHGIPKNLRTKRASLRHRSWLALYQFWLEHRP